MLVQFQAQPQTLQQAVWFTWSLNKLVVKRTKREQNLLSQGRPICDYEPWSPLDVWSCFEVCRNIPGWLQTATEGQAVVSDSATPKSASSPEHLCYSPAWNYCQVGARPEISIQSLGSPCWNFLNTHSKVCQNSGFVLLLQNDTESWLSFWNFLDLIYLLCDTLCYVEVKPHIQMTGSIIQ